MRYQIGTPKGWMGSVIQAESVEDAIKCAKEDLLEDVLDVMDWQDEDGKPIILLVVADEES
jgi:hypothetical protein